MATAALTNPELRIIPLTEADFPAVEALLDEQCAEWLDLLRWDYVGPSRLILDVIKQRELTGFVAVHGGATVGITFYVVEDNRCSIGDIYVSKPWRALGADRHLAQAILDKLDRLPRLRRVESQCVGVDNHGATELFLARGFERLDRNYMIAPLSPDSAGRGASPSGVSIRGWREDDFASAARIIHRSYRGEYDSRINSQYQTEEGCAELLTILTEHVWCGEFLPYVSRVAVDSATGNRVGVLIASEIADGAGHIGQISILPAYQGRGIGRRMIEMVMSDLEEQGYETASLAVTAANASALHLYGSCGFRTVHQFPVFYQEKQ
ncbi:MAG TPA: GNAT family N-acetyltransferase [Blastocatellia bacterium]|nr:GNAT family N-acetyltransferase [Blastocatellia bacterium]